MEHPVTSKSAHARTNLLEAARQALVEDGIGGASARTIAKRAGVAPGLIYYHFGDLDQLLAATSRVFSAERAEVWQSELSSCHTLTEVVQTASRLHVTERETGSLIMLAQLLAGGRGNETLTAAVYDNFEMLAGIVEGTISGILTGTPLETMLDAHGLSRTISAGFIGLELLDNTVPDGTDLFEHLRTLAQLADEVLGAGFITSTWLRRRLGAPKTSSRTRSTANAR
jgi:AcrR family transcriptional regulator